MLESDVLSRTQPYQRIPNDMDTGVPANYSPDSTVGPANTFPDSVVSPKGGKGLEHVIGGGVPSQAAPPTPESIQSAPALPPHAVQRQVAGAAEDAVYGGLIAGFFLSIWLEPLTSALCATTCMLQRYLARVKRQDEAIRLKELEAHGVPCEQSMHR